MLTSDQGHALVLSLQLAVLVTTLVSLLPMAWDLVRWWDQADELGDFRLMGVLSGVALVLLVGYGLLVRSDLLCCDSAHFGPQEARWPWDLLVWSTLVAAQTYRDWVYWRTVRCRRGKGGES